MGPSELNAENLGAQHMKWKALPWKIKAPRDILWEPQATGLPGSRKMPILFVIDIQEKLEPKKQVRIIKKSG